MERMLKLQDDWLKAVAKRITWCEAAGIIGVSCWTMWSWRERLEKDGYDGQALTERCLIKPGRPPANQTRHLDLLTTAADEVVGAGPPCRVDSRPPGPI
jgi:hypothetical protein